MTLFLYEIKPLILLMACSTAGKLHICKDEKSFVTNTVTGVNISIICKCLKAAEIKESIRGEASAGEPRK